MFNLLISSNPQSWEAGVYEFERSRVAIEYTADAISERYKDFTEDAIKELESFPCLFVIEGEEIETRIGYVSNIRIRSRTIVFDFEFDQNFPPLPVGTIEKIGREIDLGKWELRRSHWAVKDEIIFEILVRMEFLTQAQVESSQQQRSGHLTATVSTNRNLNQVFIVHGHDELAKLDMTKFISNLGLEPIVLHRQASSGMTIIEKIEHYSNVGFGIVLYTPCDVGAKVGALTSLHRARQNVVFEHGYLIAKLGRDRVAAMVKGSVETPNDISGVVYIEMDDAQLWQEQLRRELQSAGYPLA